MKHPALWSAVALLGILPLDAARAACYTVYQGSDLVYRSVQVPVDLSRTLHETVPSRFGAGASMVIVDSAEACLSSEAGRRTGNASTTGMRVAPRGSTSERRRGANAARYFDANVPPIRSQVGGSP